jgi:hypothetical protein
MMINYYILSSDDRNIPREAIALIIEFDFKPKDLIYKILEEYMSKVKNASLEKLNNSELSNPLQLLGTLYCGSFIFGTVIKDRSDLERISQEKGVPLPYLKKLNLSEVWNDLNFSIRRKEKNIIALIIKYYVNKGYDISKLFSNLKYLFLIPVDLDPLDTRGFEEYETKISQLLRSGSYNNLRNFLVYYRHLFSTLR